MKFQYFRFFLSPIQSNLLAQLPDSRLNSIKEVFRTDFNGEYRRMSYTIKFCNEYENIILLKIAKHTSIKRNKSPEENFEIEQIEHWPNINMLVSPLRKLNNDYGQIIAIENKPSVLKNPTNLLRDWADSKNKTLQQYGYTLSINPITEQKSFWAVIDKYKDEIEEVTFEYAMPNLFNTNDTLENDLKDTSKNYNATKASIILANNVGCLNLSKENQLLKQSVDYIEKGGGNFKIKTKSTKNTIVSASRIKTKTMEIDDLNIEAKDSSEIVNILKEILELN